MVYSEYIVLLWSKALVLDLDQAEQFQYFPVTKSIWVFFREKFEVHDERWGKIVFNYFCCAQNTFLLNKAPCAMRSSIDQSGQAGDKAALTLDNNNRDGNSIIFQTCNKNL